MARRTELKDVTTGLAKSFVSRNNRLGIKWGLGALYQFAKKNNIDVIKIDLNTKNISPQSNQFTEIIDDYHQRFHKILQSKGIPKNWVKDIFILVRFNQPYDENLHYWSQSFGDPCICICNIIDDLNNIYNTKTATCCLTQNPNKY